MSTFQNKVQGALCGTAIGDGMGASVEGWPSKNILERFGNHDFRTFLPRTNTSLPYLGKGDGRITDDTLMTEALIRAYARKGDHMDAYDYRDYLASEYTVAEVWVPEREKKMVLLDRLNPGERYTVIRLTKHLAYPRHAGIGNDIHCGIAMYMMPVGAVNAGDPSAAYREAVSLAMTQTDSYGVEGAAFLAACYAGAFAAGATIASVCDNAATLTRDGTRRAVEKVLAVVDPADSLETFIQRVREAFLPFCPADAGEKNLSDPSATEKNQPSRTLSLEEPPVAVAALKYGAGDFYKTIRAGVCYGRDCDSIAGMACGLFGAIFGVEAIPATLRATSNKANARAFEEEGSAFAATVAAIHEKDRKAFTTRSTSIGVD